jgi:hypothetical protein
VKGQAREITVALNIHLEQMRRELGEFPLHLAAHSPGGEGPHLGDPQALSDFAPQAAGRR